MGLNDIPKYTIQVNTTPGQFSIKNKYIRFQKTSGTPTMNVNTRDPKMTVDWASYWAQVGMMGVANMTEHMNTQGVQGAQQAIANFANNGDQMASVENGVDGAAALAVQGMDKKIPQVNSGMTPKDPIKVEWENGGVEISWDIPKVNIDWDSEYMPEIQYQVATVEITVKEEARKHFGLDEQKNPLVVGKKVNREA